MTLPLGSAITVISAGSSMPMRHHHSKRSPRLRPRPPPDLESLNRRGPETHHSGAPQPAWWKRVVAACPLRLYPGQFRSERGHAACARVMSSDLLQRQWARMTLVLNSAMLRGRQRTATYCEASTSRKCMISPLHLPYVTRSCRLKELMSNRIESSGGQSYGKRAMLSCAAHIRMMIWTLSTTQSRRK